jgi:16S rRNA (cytosine967-C5)-methyltransferase
MTAPAGPKPGKKAPKNRLAEISAARRAAFNILLAIERGHAHSDDLLRSHAVDVLSAPDRHLATALALGALRWQILLDHQVQRFLARPKAKLEPEVLIALRMGAFQILHMDRIPARAAIDESVELAKQAGHRFASAMINAVLRKLAAAPRQELAEDTAANLALAQAHPQWMVERWARFFGLEEARNLCRYGQAQPSITIRLCTPSTEAEGVEAGLTLDAGQLLTCSRTVIAGDTAAAAAIQDGRIRIQDEGSQLVAEIAAVQLDQSDGRILDACAAPGGKTLILAERNPQAHIVACEASAPRMEQLRQRLAAHSLQIECRHADATELAEDAAFDLVLVDVPCSGTGTLGRNPEIRHRLRPEDLLQQASRQRHLLAAALRVARPGGRVVYSTCSLEQEENEQVVAALLASTPDARPVSLAASLEALRRRSILVVEAEDRLKRALTPEGALRLLPGKFGTDGFFVAILERA